MQVTMLYAGLLGLLYLALTIRVVYVVRAKGKLLYGDADNPAYTPVLRAQVNFAEFVPMALILLALLEVRGVSATWIHGLGAALLFARAIHPFGLREAAQGPTVARFVGTLVTWLVIGAASLGNIWIALR